MAKKNRVVMLNGCGSDIVKENDSTVNVAKGKPDNSRATSLVSMKQVEKERLTKIAEQHGLSLSAFFRLAADEYIKNHDW